MMIRYSAFALCSALLILALFAFGQNSTPASKPGPVVVELFTSEGCSSCPPADRLLARLEKQHALNGTELILLGEHVDYWNDLGWKDRFAQHAFSERQEEYARAIPGDVYTPQMVVAGYMDVAGNDASAVERAISRAAAESNAAQVTLAWQAPDQLAVTVEGAPQRAAVLLFVTEDDLTTDVKSGENGGTVLHHSAVVREMRRLGSTSDGKFQQIAKMNTNSQWQKKSLRVVTVIQQQDGSGKIVSAAATSLP
jgi:hypothetical protein